MSPRIPLTILGSVFGLLAGFCIAGCQSCGEHTRDCERCAGAMPAPLGTYARGHELAQTAHAQQTAFVIHRHEWYQGSDKLGPDGRRHVNRLIQRLSNEPDPVVVERSEPDLKTQPDIDEAIREASQLDETRRRNVVSLLATGGIPDADSRVVVGESPAEGLNGNQAPRIFNQILRGGSSGGRGSFSGNSGGGGIGGGRSGGLGFF